MLLLPVLRVALNAGAACMGCTTIDHWLECSHHICSFARADAYFEVTILIESLNRQGRAVSVQSEGLLWFMVACSGAGWGMRVRNLASLCTCMTQ